MKKYDSKWLEDFLYQSTWATNAIEGNKLTLNQVISILTLGTILVPSGQNALIRLNDIKEVENGARAFNAMIYALEKNWPVNEELIKTLHHEVTKNLIDRSGQWKIYDNLIQGVSFKTVSAKETAKAISELLKWYQAELTKTKDLIKLSADFHIKFEMIHPFEDGNGRTGRLLLNYQLMSFDYFPVAFPVRAEYLDFLAQGQKEVKNWQEIEASKNFIKLIQNLSKEEEIRHNIFENERKLGLTQEHYHKQTKDDKNQT